MLSFHGHNLELTIEVSLGRHHDHPSVCTGIDHGGQNWLAVEVDSRAEQLTSLWTPASPRALSSVAAGEADPSDVIRRGRTGWVAVVNVEDGCAVADRRMTCTDVPAHWLPAATAA